MPIKKNSFLIVFSVCAFFVFSGLAFSLFLPRQADGQEEEEECLPKTIRIIARDGNGDFIPNLNFEVWRQADDADGYPKPAVKKFSGKISPTLGYYEKTFDDDEYEEYCVKFWDKNSSAGEFWFYDDITAGCGQEVEVTEYISSLLFVIRDADDELVKNQEFSVYTQKYDANDDPIKEKEKFAAKLNTSEEGRAEIYAAPGSRSIDGEGADYYVFEMKRPAGGIYTMYDIYVADGSVNDIEYIISDMKLSIYDEEGVPFPGSTEIEIYYQEYDADDNPILGGHIKDLNTDDSGTVIFEYPAGIYAARVKGADDAYIYFWDLEIYGQERIEYSLSPGENARIGFGACDAESVFTLNTKNLSGEAIDGFTFGLYEQTQDDNGAIRVGSKLAEANVNELGRGTLAVHPDPRKEYALKIYKENKSAGDFWFFDSVKFSCGQAISIAKNLPVLQIVLRGGDGWLKKNHNFSLHTQKYDVDGRPIKEKKSLVGSNYATDETGMAALYVAPDHPHDAGKRGLYVLSIPSGQRSVPDFEKYDIEISADEDKLIEYQLSDIVFSLENAGGQALPEANILLYEKKRNEAGNLILGNRLAGLKTDEHGVARLEYPAGYYALKLDDGLGRDNIFWDIQIKDRQRTHKTVSANLTRIIPVNADGSLLPEATPVNIYGMTEDSPGKFIQGKKLKALKTAASGYIEISLAQNPYLFSIKRDQAEYGRALYAENAKFQEIAIKIIDDNIIETGKKYSLNKPAGAANALADRLRGYILLQVEENGEAWYVNPGSKTRYYLKNGDSAYEMLRRFGLGITSADLKKIPVGIEERFEEPDYDGDWLSDKLEEALGTDPYNDDSDNDGYDDGTEVRNNYDPLGPGKLPIDEKFADSLSGKILLQVESRGEAWYVNPRDNRRYYMKDGASAYEIMRFLSLGITNENLDQIEAGSL